MIKDFFKCNEHGIGLASYKMYKLTDLLVRVLAYFGGYKL